MAKPPRSNPKRINQGDLGCLPWDIALSAQAERVTAGCPPDFKLMPSLRPIPMAGTDTLLATLVSCDWHVERRLRREALLPPELQRRYPLLPTEVEGFLEGLESCCNSQDTVWFLTRDNFLHVDEGRFRWNEHELMCLDAADGDEREIGRIRAYWDTHFPFLFAVHSDYDFLAVELRPESYGQIVHGYMPEPEESSPVARSFSEFVDRFLNTLRGEPEYPLSLFV